MEFDLVLLDWRSPLPVHSLLSQLRQTWPGVPILAITTDEVPEDVLSGGPGGGAGTAPMADDQVAADERIAAPLSMQELTARVKTLLNRGALEHPTPDRAPATYSLTIDPNTRSCYCRGQSIALTHREFDVLNALFAYCGRTVSREALAKQAWGEPGAVLPRTVDRHVANIRRKIEEDPAAPVYLHTVYGEGYRLTPDQQPRINPAVIHRER